MTEPELSISRNFYTRPFPSFQRPRIIGFIGLENLQFARQVCNKSVKFDLNLLIDEAKRKPVDLDVKITELLKFLLENQFRLNMSIAHNLDNAKFFCYRGLMTCVACTPYEQNEAWKIVAVLYKGNIYLCARDTEEKLKRKLNMTDKEKKFTSWGYKFEQYMLSDTPNSLPTPNVPVDENEEFSLVFTTNLNRHSIVYGAEMDGIRCDKGPVPLPPDKEMGFDAIVDYLSTKDFVELKTNRHIEFPGQERSFRNFKTKKWWCQSFLAGVETILCGFRNDNGMVEELKTYHIQDLVRMSRKFWNPDVCFNFLDTFFTYVKKCLTMKIRQSYGEKALKELHMLPITTMMFEWEPGQPVRVARIYNHEDDPILPGWFVDNYGKS